MIKTFALKGIAALLVCLIAAALWISLLSRQNKAIKEDLAQAQQQIEAHKAIGERQKKRRAIEHKNASLNTTDLDQTLEQQGWFRD